ncbi:MAG: hypothetical protein KH355_14325 [Clostridiales bacterium]|nr:hypothetical protein [Clostridiales bacterium]
METKNKSMKTITILLTKYSDLFGKFISGISKYGYSHASISIDEKEEVFYSFNIKGFAIEKPKKRIPKKRRAGSVCIRMQVPETIHAIIESEINRFLEKREQYTYSWWGVVLCLLHIPHKFENRYFCSQFVAELLSRSGAMELKKKESLYLPGQLVDGMECLFGTKQHIKKSRTSRDCYDNPTGFLLKSELMIYGICSGIKIGKGNNLMKWKRKVIFTSDFKHYTIIKKQKHN